MYSTPVPRRYPTGRYNGHSADPEAGGVIHENRLFPRSNEVPRDGIEPPTRGFSIPRDQGKLPVEIVFVEVSGPLVGHGVRVRAQGAYTEQCLKMGLPDVTRTAR